MLTDEQEALEQSFSQDLITALGSLGSLDFADTLPESATPEQLTKAAPALLKFLLQAGDNGYKDTIEAITDADGNLPSADNNWLYDPENEAYEGRFVDQRDGGDRVFEFTISRSGDGWQRNFHPISGVEDSGTAG